MKAAEIFRIIRANGCATRPSKGSHVRVDCGQCVSTVPVHAGRDVGKGLLRQIERDLEPCLGKGWLRKR